MRAGLSRTYISQIEKGTAVPSLNTIDKIADALDVERRKLLLEEE